LILNDTGLKIRRVEPLPKELLDQARVKNLVVSSMPNDNPSMDYVIAAFPGHKDDVISVRIIKPGKKFPNDLQSHFSRHVELKDRIVAVVEFDSPENAAVAIKKVDKVNYPGIDIKLLELGPKQAKRMSHTDSCASDTPADSDTTAGTGRKAKKKSGNRLLQGHTHKEDSASSYASSSDSDWSSFSSCSKRFNRSHGGSKSPTGGETINNSPKINNNDRLKSRSPLSSPGDSPKSPRRSKNKDLSPIRKLSPLVASESPRSSPEIQRKFMKRESEKCTSTVNPWMLQRMQLSRSTDTDLLSHKHLEVIRQPRGPDGSFGFSNHPLKKYVLVHAY